MYNSKKKEREQSVKAQTIECNECIYTNITKDYLTTIKKSYRHHHQHHIVHKQLIVLSTYSLIPVFCGCTRKLVFLPFICSLNEL